MTHQLVALEDVVSPGAHLPEIENIQRRSDGTYVISYGGYPYHATQVETPDIYERLLAEIQKGAPVTHYVEPVMPKPEPLGVAIEEYNRLRATADFLIAPLQDAVDEEEATDTEAELLKVWKKYRIALSRVSDQDGYPATVVWPAMPEGAPKH